MQDYLEKLKKEVAEALKDREIMVTSIDFREEKKYKFLTIELDKIGGIDLDTIVEATEIINPIVDKYDFIEDSFILDVISKEQGDDHNE